MAFNVFFFLLSASLVVSTAVWCNEEREEKVAYPVIPTPVPPLQPPPTASPAVTPPPPPPISYPPPTAPLKPLPPPAPPVKPLPPPAVKPLPPPAPPAVYPPALPPVKSLKDCIPLCAKRCKLHSRKRLCTRVCMTCCGRCKCVPPGTYGNREMCGKCYTDMTTHGNRFKCP